MFHACPRCGYSELSDEEGKLPLRYRAAYRYLRANVLEPDLSVKDVARQAGVTERALQMVWRKHFDMTPGDMIRRMRVDAFAKKVVRSQDSIAETARSCGLKSRSTALTAFRKVFGRTPSQLRGPIVP